MCRIRSKVRRCPRYEAEITIFFYKSLSSLGMKTTHRMSQMDVEVLHVPHHTWSDRRQRKPYHSTKFPYNQVCRYGCGCRRPNRPVSGTPASWRKLQLFKPFILSTDRLIFHDWRSTPERTGGKKHQVKPSLPEAALLHRPRLINEP
ncbi:hypothetical protein BaRGS_00007471 [Batillaria attramentaria]|uniref:Uncharacterized protein n=1 Tax=Batillaria attramentaria TaxID=370345 RepID=A0ABD0LQA4_9CAEN